MRDRECENVILGRLYERQRDRMTAAFTGFLVWG